MGGRGGREQPPAVPRGGSPPHFELNATFKSLFLQRLAQERNPVDFPKDSAPIVDDLDINGCWVKIKTDDESNSKHESSKSVVALVRQFFKCPHGFCPQKMRKKKS